MNVRIEINCAIDDLEAALQKAVEQVHCQARSGNECLCLRHEEKVGLIVNGRALGSAEVVRDEAPVDEVVIELADQLDAACEPITGKDLFTQSQIVEALAIVSRRWKT